MRQLSIDQFENEGRRVSMHTDSVGKPIRSPLFEKHSSDPGVHKVPPCLPCCLRILFQQPQRVSGLFEKHSSNPGAHKVPPCLPC